MTVLEWLRDRNVHDMGIDPRRFVAFGVFMVSACSLLQFLFSLELKLYITGFNSAGTPMAFASSGYSYEHK